VVVAVATPAVSIWVLAAAAVLAALEQLQVSR
jgi:hypothetical protein